MMLLVTAPLLLVTILQAAQPADDVKPRAAAAIAALAARDFAAVETQFDEAMHRALPAGRIGATWDALVAQAGAFKSCGTNVRVRPIADKRMVITTCEFARAAVDIQFAFAADNRISGIAMRPAAAPPAPYTPPSYVTPASYAESEVAIGSGEWALPGTLTVPVGRGPFPAVVLVHGSGPNDRDETIGPNKPFKDLALGLASRGIAVLRYDKRSKVYGAKMAGLASLTVKEEVVDDALLAVALLRAQARIDPARVYVLGHSLGGTLIPRIAAAGPGLAGAVIMAGAARPLEQALVEQTKYLAGADGSVTPQEQAQIDAAEQVAAAVAALTPADASSSRLIFGAPAAYWLDLRGYDAPARAKALATPLLILQGQRDYQVTMDDFERWRSALADRKGVTFHTYPSLNHLFMSGTGQSLPAEYDQPSHVSEDVVRDIAAWILAPPPPHAPVPGL